MQVIRELDLISKIAEEIATNIECFPEGNEDSFKLAFSACRLKMLQITKTQFINGLLHYLSVSFDCDDIRLRPCGQLLGVERLTMKAGRLNALSLVSDFRNSS